MRIETGPALVCEYAGARRRASHSTDLLCALGRVPNTAGYGLEELGIPVTKARRWRRRHLQTLYPNIYACGDVAGPISSLTRPRTRRGIAARQRTVRPFKRFRADYSLIPWATFTDPEVARVGLNEAEAKERGIASR